MTDMTAKKIIAADQAQKLLNDATDGPWFSDSDNSFWYEILGRDGTRPGFYPIICDVDEVGDANLISSAPELAHTVIVQNERMVEVRDYLQGMADRARRERRRGLARDLQQAVDVLSEVVSANS